MHYSLWMCVLQYHKISTVQNGKQQSQAIFKMSRLNSIQDGGALVVNILVFDLRMPVQHRTYQGETLLFALIKVNTFICKREISDFSSPLNIA